MQKELQTSENFEILKWDSEFFGYPVARVNANLNDSRVMDDILASMAEKGIHLGYFASPEPLGAVVSDQTPYEFVMADLKVTYLKELHGFLEVPSVEIKQYEKDVPDDQLIHLAIESGIYSRFKRDSHFAPGSYEKLYQIWIRKSVDKTIAKALLTFIAEGSVAGFVTLGIKNGRGDIGIIAVDEKYRGRRIGSKLMSAAEHWFYQSGYKTVQVVTQGDNKPACRLYEGCGYHRESALFFYHLWKKS